MTLGKAVIVGQLGAFLLDGVDINKIDLKNQCLYLTLPKEGSYAYEMSDLVATPEKYAKRIKEVWIELGIFKGDCSVKYKVKDEIWTKEMGDANFEKNKDHMMTMSFGY